MLTTAARKPVSGFRTTFRNWIGLVAPVSRGWAAWIFVSARGSVDACFIALPVEVDGLSRYACIGAIARIALRRECLRNNKPSQMSSQSKH
jgi:hypothetical protein